MTIIYAPTMRETGYIERRYSPYRGSMYFLRLTDGTTVAESLSITDLRRYAKNKDLTITAEHGTECSDPILVNPEGLTMTSEREDV